MKKMLSPVYDCVVRDEEGATMVEYGLMVALIAVVSIGAVTALGGSLNTLFSGVQTDIVTADPKQ